MDPSIYQVPNEAEVDEKCMDHACWNEMFHRMSEDLNQINTWLGLKYWHYEMFLSSSVNHKH